jgi:Transcription factor WhiB
MEIEACKGSDPELFYEGSLDDGQTPRLTADHLLVAAKYCDQCTQRTACLVSALGEEATAPMKHRFGLRAGLTPAQRYSVHKRGGANCPSCKMPFDPMSFRTGVLACKTCGFTRRVQAIPPEGDDWQDRHTLLAARVLDYFVTHHSKRGDKAKLPSPHWLSKKFIVRKADVSRVYDALAYDMTIEKVGVVYYLRATKVELRLWVPPHFVSVYQAWRTLTPTDEKEA